MTNSPHMETTQKAYHNEYEAEVPNYDLYPSLSRRLINGYVHQPMPPGRRQPKDTNFINMNHQTTVATSRSNPMTMTNSTVSGQQLGLMSSHEQDNQPAWDLYPSILRNIENFGTEQMKQQLHAMEATTM